jgi:hypothetical protein
MTRFGLVAAALVWALTAVASWAADSIETVTIPAGAPFVQVGGTVVGWDLAHYRIEAVAGQQLRVQMTADSGTTSFNIMPPGGRGGAIFQGVTGGTEFVGRLQESGTYVVTVFQSASVAETGNRTHFALALSLSGRLFRGERAIPPIRQGGAYVIVDGMDADTRLILRRNPTATGDVLHRVARGQRLMVRQCRVTGATDWCYVTSQTDLNVRGWAEGRFLRNE